MTTVAPDTDIQSRVLGRIQSKPDEVWTPGDFADLGGRAAVDKSLQRLAAAGELRRIDRGLYDKPRTNSLTGRATVPDYRAVIRAVTRRDNARTVIDGMTAANDLGLTTAVPARIEVLVDARLKPIKLGSQEIHFKYAAPSRLYWANRPGMRVVQALHWLQDMLAKPDERKQIEATLRRLLADPKHGEAIEDLGAGLSAVPIWMQEFLRDLLSVAPLERSDEHGGISPDHRSAGTGPPRSVSGDRQSDQRAGRQWKDFWVCWTLNALLPRARRGWGRCCSRVEHHSQRLRQSAVFGRHRRDRLRDDLEEPASVEELEALSNKKRRARLDAIRNACRAYITGPLRAFLAGQLADVTNATGRVEVDEADPDGQTLLLWYPEVEPRDGAYVRPAIRLESGAKSALDPHGPLTIAPYVAEEAAGIDLAVPDVTTIEATRTFWDKVVIAHGLRRWYEQRGELRQEGQRVSRHYYDLHCLVQSDTGKAALADLALGADCVRHARMFFDRPDYDLPSAVPGSFAIAPVSGMVEALARDYANTTAMIFGAPPSFEDILASANQIEKALNAGKTQSAGQDSAPTK